ncbi:MAG: hypothetical protein IJI73_00165, partial [Kiritimatiellae bacterium]|nr:hypothetical protein [Kiritimatiellia bacterium]
RRGGSAAVPAGPARVAVAEQVVVTNVVAVTEVVTNTVTVTNEVAAVPPPRVLSRRKTAPYTVVCGVMRPEELRGSVSKAGARAISALPASVALVEANDRAVSALRDDGVFRVEELRAADKIARGVLPLRAGAEPSAEGTVSVKISPLSAIDVGEISSAVAALGGEAKEDFEEGRPVVRATLSEKAVVELARRGDVLRIDGGVR